MAGNNLAVKITADVIDLQVKFATARAETQALSAEMNKLARASVNGGLDQAATARLQQVAGDMLHARQEASGYASALAAAGFASNAMGGATREMHGSLSTATREFRALFDELSSGRTHQIPGTLAIIATRVFGLGPAALGATAGVVGLVGALGYLAYRAVEASHAIDQVHLASLEAGNDISRLQFSQLADQLGMLPGVSESAGREIVSALGGIHMPLDAFTAAARLASEQMRLTGSEAKKVGEEFAKALDPNRKAVDVAKDIGGLTQAQVDEAKAADESKNQNAILAEKLSLLSTQVGRARSAVDEYSKSWWQAISTGVGVVSSYLAGGSTAAIQAQAQSVQQQATAWKANASAIQQSIAALRELPAEQKPNYEEKDNSAAESERYSRIAQLEMRRHELVLKDAERELEANEKYLQAVEEASREQVRAQQDASNMKMRIATEEFESNSRWLQEYAREQDRLNREQAFNWIRTVHQIEGAESSFIRSVLSGRQSLSQNLKNLAINLATAEISAAARAVTERLLLQKSAATQERAVSAQVGAKTVMQDAAKAFSGTYASVAQIPYVGWILAPAAASAAYAAVAAYEGLASLDVGTPYIPQTGLYQLHEGEAVVPKTFAQGMRDGDVSLGGGSETHHYHGDTNIRAIDTQDFARAARRNRGALGAALVRAYRRGAFS